MAYLIVFFFFCFALFFLVLVLGFELMVLCLPPEPLALYALAILRKVLTFCVDCGPPI
jgi:hypothetical protein